MNTESEKGRLIDASGVFEQKQIERPNEFDALCEIYAHMQICLEPLSRKDALKVLRKLPARINTLTTKYKRHRS